MGEGSPQKRRGCGGRERGGWYRNQALPGRLVIHQQQRPSDLFVGDDLRGERGAGSSVRVGEEERCSSTHSSLLHARRWLHLPLRDAQGRQRVATANPTGLPRGDGGPERLRHSPEVPELGWEPSSPTPTDPAAPGKGSSRLTSGDNCGGFSPLTASPEAIQPTSPSLDEEAPTLSVFSLVCPGNTVTPASAISTHRREKGPQCQAAFPPPLPTPSHTLQGPPWLCFLGERPGFLCPYEHVPLPLRGSLSPVPSLRFSAFSVSLGPQNTRLPVLWLVGVQPVGVPAGAGRSGGEEAG